MRVMPTLVANLRFALRDLRHRPTFAATVVLTLAVGIGATTAAFALVDAVFLSRLPVQDQDRVVVLSSTPPSRWAATTSPWPVPWGIGRVLAEQHRAFEGVAGVWTGSKPSPYAARYRGRTLHVGRASVSGNFFQVLGVHPAVGRMLEPGDDVTGGPSVVVLSYRLWHTQLGGDPQVLGQLLFFEGIPYRVVGVAPPEFTYPAGASVWVPVVQELYSRFRLIATDDPFSCFLIGRLSPGISQTRARTELEAALRSYVPSAKYLAGYGNLPTGGRVERFTDVVLGSEVRPGTLILFGAVILVLMIACTNVAGLLLARGMARAGELGIRSSLGATRSQLLAHVLTESVLLAVVGGVLGLALAAALVHAAVALAPPELPMVSTARLDGRVLAFAMTITVMSAIGAGLVPALREVQTGHTSAVGSGNRSMTGGPAMGLGAITGWLYGTSSPTEYQRRPGLAL
jgi:putative ABC transport system permease protein